MRQFKAMIALCLAMLWVPATCHCLFENVEWVKDSNCCSTSTEHDTSSDPDECFSCYIVENGDYKPETRLVEVPSADLFPVLILKESVCLANFSDSAIYEAAASPPGLVVSWRFDQRAALPARAPSCFS